MGCCDSREEHSKIENYRKSMIEQPQLIKRRARKLKTLSGEQLTNRSNNGKNIDFQYSNPDPDQYSIRAATPSVNKHFDFDADQRAQTPSLHVRRNHRRRTTVASRGSFIINVPQAIRVNYERVKTLFHGELGEIILAKDKRTGLLRVTKEIKKKFLQEKSVSQFLKEVESIKELDHPNTIKMYEIIDSEDSYYFVLEYLMGGNLAEKLAFTFISEQEAGRYIKSIVEAVIYCQNCGIIHKNLRPENILFDSKSEDAVLKLTGFEFDWKIPRGYIKGELVEYLAPEIINGSGATTASDIWSIGVLLFRMIYGKVPFSGIDSDDVYKSIEYGVVINEDILKLYSSSIKDLLKKMLVFDPNKRISAIDILNHPWIKEFGQQKELLYKYNYQQIARIPQFYNRNEIEKAVLIFTNSQIPNFDEEKAYIKLFKRLNKDHSGFIHKSDLIEFIRRTKHNHLKEADYDLQQMDLLDEVHIKFSELETATTDWNLQVHKDRVANALKICFKNGTNYLSLYNVIQRMPSVDSEKWARLFKNIDKNGDGKLSIEEFIDSLERTKHTHRK